MDDDRNISLIRGSTEVIGLITLFIKFIELKYKFANTAVVIFPLENGKLIVYLSGVFLGLRCLMFSERKVDKQTDVTTLNLKSREYQKRITE